MSQVQVQRLITGRALREYFMAHVTESREHPGFFVVHKPLHVFKKLVGEKIANLVIPVGAKVFVDQHDGFGKCADGRKMRADKAYVHSIVGRIKDGCPPVSVGQSKYNFNFEYRTGKTVVPRFPFSFEPYRCESGIHFFLNVMDAVNY